MSSNLCIIPAKEISKRLPNKNILKIKEKYLISYSIEQAILSKIFDKIVVASDSKEILSISNKYEEIDTMKLPKFMCNETTSASLSCVYIYEKLSKNYDTICLLQPTSPLRLAKDIQDCFSVLAKDPENNFVVSVTEIDHHEFHFAIREGIGGYELFFGEKNVKDGSLFDTVYRPNGAIKIAKSKEFLDKKHFFGKKLEISLMPKERSIHVATKFDFEICEMMINKHADLYNYSS